MTFRNKVTLARWKKFHWDDKVEAGLAPMEFSLYRRLSPVQKALLRAYEAFVKSELVVPVLPVSAEARGEKENTPRVSEIAYLHKRLWRINTHAEPNEGDFEQ